LLKTAENLFISNSKAILGGELQGISQENLGFSSFYHSRLVSEYFVELLSIGWDTPVEEIIDMGDSWALSADLILACSSGMKSVER